MSIIVDFIAELSSITEVSTAVDTRINPLIDDLHVLPTIVYNTRGGIRESYIKDSFGLRETFIQLDLYSKDYSELDIVRDAIISRFNGFTGHLNTDGALVSSSKVTTTRELPDGQNREVLRAIIEINILSA